MVFAIEPSASAFTLLLNNTGDFGNIIPLNIAASNSNKITDFFETKDNAFSGLKDTRRKKILKKLKIFSYKLDDLILALDLSKINLIKIDVEGWETFALKGAEKIIERYRPIIFCEVYRGIDSNLDPDEAINFIKNKNYLVFVVKNFKLSMFESHDDRFYNYFFFPVEMKNII